MHLCGNRIFSLKKINIPLQSISYKKGRAQVYGIDFFEQGNEAINEEIITVNHNHENFREIWSIVRNDDGKLISLKDKSNGIIYLHNAESNAIE